MGVRQIRARKHRRYLVSDYLINHPQAKAPEIVAAFEEKYDLIVSVAMVRNDLKILDATWRSQSVVNQAQAKEESIAEWRQIQEEAWEAWKHSLEPKVKTKVRKSKDGEEETTEEITQSNGDPRYLIVIENCRKQIDKILGAERSYDVDWMKKLPDGVSKTAVFQHIEQLNILFDGGQNENTDQKIIDLRGREIGEKSEEETE